MIRKSILYTFFVFILGLWLFNSTYACEYLSEIEECVSANKNWSNESIQDYVCRVWNYEEIAYQVVLDMEFKPVDEEMDKYIQDLEDNKNYYFWSSRKKNFIEWLNDVETKSKYFQAKYLDLCWTTIISKVIDCMEDKKVWIKNIQDYFKTTTCRDLVDKKIEIFNDVTAWILMLNKKQVLADEKKLYDQWARNNYNKLLELMMVNLWYIERILAKWPAKLANTM